MKVNIHEMSYKTAASILPAIQKDISTHKEQVERLTHLEEEIKEYNYDKNSLGWDVWDMNITRVLQAERKLADKVGLTTRVKEIDLMLSYYSSIEDEYKNLKEKYEDLRVMEILFKEIADSGTEHYSHQWRLQTIERALDTACKYPEIYKHSYDAIIEHLECSDID